MDRTDRALLALVLVTWLGACAAPGPSASPTASGAPPSPVVSGGVAVTPTPSDEPAGAAERIHADLASLQAVADANGGIRFTGTPGYDESVALVAERLRGIGLEVQTPDVPFVGFHDDASSLEVGGRTFRGPDEVRALIYSPSGGVRGRVVHLDGSGCEPDDFDPIEPGDLALTTQGGCFRRDQVLNAVEAGAAALLVGYPGRGPGAIYRPTLIRPEGMEIPALSVTEEALRLLTGPGGGDVRLEVTTRLPSGSFRHVVGQLGDGPRVVMVGAHLDSVLDGPGINDNGSGVAAVLEIARAVAAAGVPDGWALRVGLWGGEELGSIGSRAYAETVGAEVAAYINLDMAGSVNGITFVYDEPGAAPGSRAITDAFEAALDARDEPSRGVDLAGSSDHFGFQQAGIPTGGLFAGATETGSGSAPDPCYHIGCDDLDNVDVDRVVLFAVVTAEVVTRFMETE